MKQTMMAVTTLALTGLLAGQALGQADIKCEATKAKAAGSYAHCRQAILAKFIKSGDAEKLAAARVKCQDKLLAAFTKAETKAGDLCPTDGDAGSVRSFLDEVADGLDNAFGVDGSVPRCGDKIVNRAGEQCDDSDLNGTSCASLGHDLGTLSCSGCRFVTDGCSSCAAGTEICSNTCVDTQTDALHCGGCGNACEVGEACEAGTCVVPPPPCPGFEYADKCWILAPAQQTCTTACAAEGLALDAATEELAGASGDNDHCAAVMTGLGYPTVSGGLANSSCSNALHCHYDLDNSFAVRCVYPYSGDSSALGTRRACACS